MGHVAFSPFHIKNNQNCKAYILVHLVEDYGYQKNSVHFLLDRGLKILTDDGIHLFFVNSNSEFYRRLGFRTNTASEFNVPFDL